MTSSPTSAQDVAASAASAATAQLLASLPKTDLATVAAYHHAARGIPEGLPKLDFSGILQPQMTAVEQLLASMPKILPPQILASHQPVDETAAGPRSMPANPTGESHDAETSDKEETDEGESGG
ncbi:hypothetical protein ACWD4O_43055 [Streptomyces sp. NPDC002623]